MSEQTGPERDGPDGNWRDPRFLVSGRYLVDVTHELPDAGGAVTAYAASARGGGDLPLMALRVGRRSPARPRALQGLVAPIPNLLTPIAYGGGPPVDGQPGWFVICQAPPGPPLSRALRPWPEASIIEFVLRPVATVLERMHDLSMTHRGIRPDNVFQSQPNRPVTLGAAWAAPPAMHQPAVFETAYTALCHPAARGDGHISDDVYALGVLLVTLALGRPPMGGLDDKAIMYRKLELGDFAAIAGTERSAPVLTDIIRGMLAEDPEHRPTPAMLHDAASARGRRIAARPASRAQRPMRLGAMTVWNSKTLALAMATEPDEALAAVLSGTLMYWLRRGLGDAALAVKLEELVRHHALDASTTKEAAQYILVMRAIADADIFMPVCWRDFAMFPDGLGTALAVALEGDPELERTLYDIVNHEAQGIWAITRDERVPSGPYRLEARQRRAVMQIRGPAGGLPRLAYTLNPMTPCASPLLGDRWVASISDLTAALEAAATTSSEATLLEPRIAAFIGARSERWLDQEVQALANGTDTPDGVLTTLRLLSELQNRYYPVATKGLTAWIAARAQPLVDRWQNRDQRAAVAEQLKTLTALGFLSPILELLRDPAAHARDSEGLRAARVELDLMDAEMRGIADGGRHRAAVAARLGQEIAAGVGLAAVAITLLLAALG